MTEVAVCQRRKQTDKLAVHLSSGSLTGILAFQAGGDDAMNSSIADVSSSSYPCIAVRQPMLACTCPECPPSLTVFDNPLVVPHELIRHLDLIVSILLQQVPHHLRRIRRYPFEQLLHDLRIDNS